MKSKSLLVMALFVMGHVDEADAVSINQRNLLIEAINNEPITTKNLKNQTVSQN